LARSRKRGRRGPPTATPTPPHPVAVQEPTTLPVAVQVPTTRPGLRDAQSPPAHLPQPRESKSEARNAEIRATLRPYGPGEHPAIIIVATLVAAGLGLANLIAWLAGDKISGHRPAAGGIIVFSALLLACATGMWRMWYGAVLGFMALMAIIAVLFTLFLIEASNVLGAVVAVAIIAVSGYLFFKLVRVLSRLQMPKAPDGSRRTR
jgi:hypothetical protein